jgi:2,3-dihydroxy-p-cumate/2,3-dihydroxybenzoate 3,4-dioxygenase
MVFEYSSGVKSIADELLYRERQFPSDPKGFCHWGAQPQTRQFQQ